jgi:Lipocalin-like domain
MKSFVVLTVVSIMMAGVTLPSTGAMSQSFKDQLIGHWTFVSSIDTNRDGTKTNRFGPNAKGVVMFDASGRFSFFVSRADIPKFAINNVNQGTAEENKAVVQGMIAFYGTWSVDEGSKTLITNVEAASFPNLSGGTQRRTITSLTADELKYTNASTTAGTSSDVVWRRTK